MSNISPQRSVFNRGIWKELEERVRQWAHQGYELYIVTGPVLIGGSFEVIGRNKVAVPENFYKVILRRNPSTMNAIAFVIPNRMSDEGLEHFALSVNMAEEITGIDFFPELDDSIE